MNPSPTQTPDSTASQKWDPPASAGAPPEISAAGRFSVGEKDQPSGPPLPTRRVRQEDVIYFCSQLTVMVETGVPLADALDAIASEAEHTGVKAMVHDLSEQVKTGVEFSRALESYPRQFPSIFISLMRASEASGQMGMMLQRVSDYMVQERDVRRKVKGAMAYPLAMLSFCLVVVGCLLVFVLPQFQTIYEGKGAVLPAPTKFLLTLSDTIINQWYFVLGGGIASVVGLIMYARTDGGRRVLDYLRINLPVIGPMYRKSYLSRSLRTLATMTSTGVGVLDALEITAQVAGNRHYENVWRGVSERAEEGKTLAEGLRGNPLIPAGIAQMVSAGEQTGKLDSVLDRVADFCDDELNQAIKTMTSFIEPVMIIVIGGLIGAIAIALLLPIFSVSKVMSS
ncbi:MAG: type II secretion system F family protein [Planctomycetota bacterium]